jgi:hypothetical protein
MGFEASQALSLHCNLIDSNEIRESEVSADHERENYRLRCEGDLGGVEPDRRKDAMMR